MSRLRVALVLFLVGAIVFANSLGNSFVWDDEEQVVNNAVVHSLRNWPQFFAGSHIFNSSDQY